MGNWIKNWFSNMVPYKVPLVENNITYSSPEHYYQANKSIHEVDRSFIADTSSPYLAKKRGRQIRIRPDWDQVKESIMIKALQHRIDTEPRWRDQLIAEPSPIVERNNWHDNTWGHCICLKCKHKEKKNLLGKILTKLKEEQEFSF